MPVEANTYLLDHLHTNYSPHPAHVIANSAIGQAGRLTLYAVNREFWSMFQPACAEGRPGYPATTGITSAISSHLEQF
ncbi:MAG: hypothetical protein KFB97_06895 [Cyanobium sp. M30B3]|nr:MAG: hypothetical protein KFB97_06895 [Cyanobium sp. M30B3]